VGNAPGSILAAATRQGVCAILLGDDPDTLVRDLQDRFLAQLVGGDADFEQPVAKVVGFVESPQQLDLPLMYAALFSSSESGKRCERYRLHSNPCASPRASERRKRCAVAPASVTVAVAIPCHRVVRHDGGLSGYRWAEQRTLLEREAE
jgi:AraC family transcriptional regulator of adaptative response/methylated-DNA-[protein]-cysteine methyltransferase